jgi:hypothetical protein
MSDSGEPKPRFSRRSFIKLAGLAGAAAATYAGAEALGIFKTKDNFDDTTHGTVVAADGNRTTLDIPAVVDKPMDPEWQEAASRVLGGNDQLVLGSLGVIAARDIIQATHDLTIDRDIRHLEEETATELEACTKDPSKRVGHGRLALLAAATAFGVGAAGSALDSAIRHAYIVPGGVPGTFGDSLRFIVEVSKNSLVTELGRLGLTLRNMGYGGMPNEAGKYLLSVAVDLSNGAKSVYWATRPETLENIRRFEETNVPLNINQYLKMPWLEIVKKMGSGEYLPKEIGAYVLAREALRKMLKKMGGAETVCQQVKEDTLKPTATPSPLQNVISEAIDSGMELTDPLNQLPILVVP